MTVLAIRKPALAARRLRYFEARALDPRLSPEERKRCRDEADNLDTQLRASDRCRRCGRHLEDPDSVRIGLGPDCRQKSA